MAQRFRIEVAGQAEFNRSFIRLKDNIEDLTPEWEAAFVAFQTIQAEQFNTEGQAGATGRWLPLSENYGRWKELNYPGTKILERTGRLKDSLIGETSDTVKKIDKLSAEFGTLVPYAMPHQIGGGGGRPPRREVISFSERQKTFLMKEIQKKLVERIKAGAR